MRWLCEGYWTIIYSAVLMTMKMYDKWKLKKSGVWGKDCRLKTEMFKDDRIIETRD